MRSPFAIIACLAAVSWVDNAHAAEVTDMPPALRGDVSIDYTGAFQFGSIRQDGEKYGRRKFNQHDLLYTLEFSPTDGLAFSLRIDTTPWVRIRFTDAYRMAYDPVADAGTYIGSDSLASPPEIDGRGMSGIWLGVVAAPFAEWFARSHQVSYRFDIAFRTPNKKHTMWTYTGDGRGSAPGGSAWLLSGAFSRDQGITNPYLTGSMKYEGRAIVDIVDETETTLATDATVRAATVFDIRTGVEIIAGENRETGERFAFDLFLGFGYRSWADVASGVLLPHVLDQTRALVVTEGDHLVVTSGFALDYHANQYFGARLGTRLRYLTPHQIESAYPVMTGADTLEFALTTSIEGRIR